ncbi:SMI1/KNR4 family protein [Cytobacillus massiliigabonensis]|uniref:SMI1/KNR4 family protein n=1 Tax=Cytobacillus massiliigabonensis TaxID=1871011 RepID=UPI000C84E3EB|nr:SMI1/KNR4 family protein [Cytobacillus massiliigabonensis]
MEDLQFLISRWKQILQKLEKNNGKVYQMEIGEKATQQEIEAKEKELGCQLPPSYKYIVQNIGKSLSFYYSFSEDTMIPSEFSEIFSGEIHWNIDCLQNLTRLADQLMEDGEDYGETLRGKLEFAHAGNGDVYAFDISVDRDEKPVIYWDHEEDTVNYIADSFIDYLLKITEIGCVGSEKWQFEYFLSDSGLDTASLAAVKWKQWFETFSETALEDVKNNMEQLAAFVVYRGKIDEETIDFFMKFNRHELFQFLLTELKGTFKEQKLICEIIGRVLGFYAEAWVTSLWDAKPDHIDTRLRSYLTSMCISKDKGLPFVLNFLEQAIKKLNGYEALSHLGDFHSRDVISWMENHVTFPVTDGWDELFVRSNFSWDDIERWTSLEEKHEATVIHALEKHVREKAANNRFAYAIPGLPAKSEFLDFLVELRNKQVLKKRILLIENVIQNIHILY